MTALSDINNYCYVVIRYNGHNYLTMMAESRTHLCGDIDDEARVNTVRSLRTADEIDEGERTNPNIILQTVQ